MWQVQTSSTCWWQLLLYEHQWRKMTSWQTISGVKSHQYQSLTLTNSSCYWRTLKHLQGLQEAIHYIMSTYAIILAYWNATAQSKVGNKQESEPMMYSSGVLCLPIYLGNICSTSKIRRQTLLGLNLERKWCTNTTHFFKNVQRILFEWTENHLDMFYLRRAPWCWSRAIRSVYNGNRIMSLISWSKSSSVMLSLMLPITYIKVLCQCGGPFTKH